MHTIIFKDSLLQTRKLGGMKISLCFEVSTSAIHSVSENARASYNHSRRRIARANLWTFKFSFHLQVNDCTHTRGCRVKYNVTANKELRLQCSRSCLIPSLWTHTWQRYTRRVQPTEDILPAGNEKEEINAHEVKVNLGGNWKQHKRIHATSSTILFILMTHNF